MAHATAMALGVVLAIGLGVGTSARAQAPSPNPPGVTPVHYQCYKAAGQFQPVPVKLVDQFGGSPNVRVLQPAFLCAPVGKNGEPIADERTHLVCFTDSGVRPPNRAVRVTNQFGTQILKVTTPAALCVPSIKQLG